MVSADEFVNGGRIRWRALAGTIIGGVAFAVWEGFIELINRWVDVVVGLLANVTSFNVEIIQLRVGTFVGLMNSAWQQTLAFVEESGLIAFVVALAIVLATLWVVSQGVSRIP